MQQLFIIGGPNGAGKTTTAMRLLPDLLQCDEYVNADAIAAALSPFHPETTAIQAGRLMLNRILHLSSENKNFAFETTLASRSFVPFLKKCKNNGYSMNLLFLWLDNVELAIERVNLRVKSGGHNIPEEDICRRYNRGKNNFLELYLPLADTWKVYNNSSIEPVLVSEKFDGVPIIYQATAWSKFVGELNYDIR